MRQIILHTPDRNKNYKCDCYCNDNVMIANNECLLCVKPHKHASFYLSQQPYEIDIENLVFAHEEIKRIFSNSNAHLSTDRRMIHGERMREVKISYR